MHNQWYNFLSSSQTKLANKFYNFANTELINIANIIDENKCIPKKVWQDLAQANMLGITVSKNYNGQALGYTEQCLAMSAISSINASLGLSYAAHDNLCINQLSRFATTTQANKYLPKLINGEHLGALAISEANAGSDAMSIQLKAQETPQGFVLNGKKKWITNAPDANVIIVYANSKHINNKNYLSAFIIDTNIKGWKIGNIPNKLGMRGSQTAEIIFNNCLVPFDNLLGTAHAASKIMMSGLDYERIILAAGPIGIMQHCLNIVIPYLNNRVQFKQTLSQFQLMQAKVADMYVQYQAAKSLVFNTAIAADQQIVDAKDCATCLLFAARAATNVALETIQALGAIGYSTDYPAAQLLADAKLYEIGGGTNEIRQLIIGKNLLNN